MRVQRCKGTRDLFPEEMARFRLIEGAFRECCLKGGYEEVRTPTLEYLHLFTSTGTLTPGKLDKVYSFLDWDGWSGERVVLRPDNTIPVARFYIDSMSERELAKLFYVANVFSFEGTGKETRERWQGGAELIGANSPLADVELITLALEVLKRLGLSNIKLKLSHAGLIRALLMQFGLSLEEQSRIFSRILDGDEEALTRLKPKRPELSRALTHLLKLRGKSSGFLKNFKALFLQDLPELESSCDNFISVINLLEALDYDYRVDITTGRGFEYYTGIIFQFFMGKERIGGGGRYDNLIPLMGSRNVPASGFALEFDRLMSLVKSESQGEPLAHRILIRTKPEVAREGFSIASQLREAGCVAQLHLGGQEPVDSRWIVDVRDKAPQFVVTDPIKHQELEFRTANEVLTFLGEQGGDKDSIA